MKGKSELCGASSKSQKHTNLISSICQPTESIGWYLLKDKENPGLKS
jgi:hypothetical protein